MKILLSIFLIVIRLIVGFNVISWLINEFIKPELHSISDIEFYLVFLLFDIWISISNNGIDHTKVD
jgi:hypothetical protein